MVVDPPYGLSIFENVIDCHWGNDWLAIRTDLKVPASVPTLKMNWDLEFPDQAGGTPGYVMFALDVPNPLFKPAPVNLQQYVNGELRTLAGARMTGVGIRGLSDAPNRTAVALYIKLDANMPRSPFRVRAIYVTNSPTSGSGDIELVNVATIRNFKPVRIVSGGWLPDGIGEIVSFKEGQTESVDVNKTFDFRVYPDTLRVDDPVIS